MQGLSVDKFFLQINTESLLYDKLVDSNFLPGVYSEAVTFQQQNFV